MIHLTSKLHNLMLWPCSTSMSLTYHVWFRVMDLLRPMQQAMLNMSTSLQGDESPKSLRLCICSARRSIRRILASFLHAQTGLHLQQLGLHTRQQTKYIQQSKTFMVFCTKSSFQAFPPKPKTFYVYVWMDFSWPGKAIYNPLSLLFFGFTSRACQLCCAWQKALHLKPTKEKKRWRC